MTRLHGGYRATFTGGWQPFKQLGVSLASMEAEQLKCFISSTSGLSRYRSLIPGITHWVGQVAELKSCCPQVFTVRAFIPDDRLGEGVRSASEATLAIPLPYERQNSPNAIRAF